MLIRPRYAPAVAGSCGSIRLEPQVNPIYQCLSRYISYHNLPQSAIRCVVPSMGLVTLVEVAQMCKTTHYSVFVQFTPFTRPQQSYPDKGVEGCVMGKVATAGVYAGQVQLQLVSLRATNALTDITSYMRQWEREIAGRWNEPWDAIANLCLHLKKWKTWAYYETDPLRDYSETQHEAKDISRFLEILASDGFWVEFLDIELELLFPLVEIIEDICGVHGIPVFSKNKPNSGNN